MTTLESTQARPRSRFWHSPYFWGLVLGIATITLMRPLLRREPAPPPVLGQLPAFRLVNERGETWGSTELSGQVWVANFVFTRCASICPRLTQAMHGLQERYAAAGVEGVHLVSFTVDPEYDTPEVLRAYGEARGADSRRWTFLTGALPDVERVLAGFHFDRGEVTESPGDLVDISHTGKFVLVDGAGRVRGYYDADELGLDEVFHRSQHVLREGT